MAVRYPGDNATAQQYTEWMRDRMVREGLPPELPVMAALTESGLKNLPGGDRDSSGFFQMRQGVWGSQYGNYVKNPERQLDWFVNTAKSAKRGNNLGEWVANIERPAEQYRGRYQQHLTEARSLLGNSSQNGVTGVTIAQAQTQGVSGFAGDRMAIARNDMMSALMAGSDPRAGNLNGAVASMRAMFDAPVQRASAPNPTADPGADPVDVALGGTATGSKAARLAMKFQGTPYVWGGTDPKGFDCSGLIQYSYGKLGVKIPRVAADQFRASTPVNDPQPGDLVFWKGYTNSATNPGHVGMYIGNGQYIQAPKTGDVVKVSNVADRPNGFLGYRRIGG